MKLFWENIGERRLQNALKYQVREKSFLNYEHIRSIGFVFDAEDAESFNEVKKYMEQLKSDGKRVNAIAFYNHKKLPENFSYSKSDLDIFTSSQINLFGQPKTPYIHTFITEVRDVLVDVNLKQIFPLRYIAAQSYAKCKIGPALQKNMKTHDLLISTDLNPGAGYFLKQVDRYLKMINKN